MAKTITYGIMHFCVATVVAYAVTGNWQMSLGIGLIEPAVQTVAYVLHERAWRTHQNHTTQPVQGVLCAV